MYYNISIEKLFVARKFLYMISTLVSYWLKNITVVEQLQRRQERRKLGSKESVELQSKKQHGKDILERVKNNV